MCFDPNGTDSKTKGNALAFVLSQWILSISGAQLAEPTCELRPTETYESCSYRPTQHDALGDRVTFSLVLKTE